MAAACHLEPQESGFVFDNCKRNALIEAKGFKAPIAQKTGTTIVGVVVKDAVVLGADTRATEGDIVADKCCKKIHYLAKNMHCCGAGTAADTEMTTKTISSQLQLLKLNTGRTVPVVAANRLLKQMLFRYQGHIGAALVLGGVDNTGPHLYSIHPHGSTDKLPYTTMGSGSLAALSVLDSNWKPGMSIEEGKKLVRDAISAGIFNDLGSGGSVDLCVIQSNSVEYLTPYEEGAIAMKGKRDGNYKYNKGTTAVLAQKVKKIPLIVEKTIIKPHQSPEQPMEIS